MNNSNNELIEKIFGEDIDRPIRELSVDCFQRICALKNCADELFKDDEINLFLKHSSERDTILHLNNGTLIKLFVKLPVIINNQNILNLLREMSWLSDATMITQEEDDCISIGFQIVDLEGQ